MPKFLIALLASALVLGFWLFAQSGAETPPIQGAQQRAGSVGPEDSPDLEPVSLVAVPRETLGSAAEEEGPMTVPEDPFARWRASVPKVEQVITKGRVVLGDGEPVQDCLSVRIVNGNEVAAVSTDPNGDFFFRSEAARTLEISVHLALLSGESPAPTLVEAGATGVELQVDALFVELVRADGRPLGDGSLVIRTVGAAGPRVSGRARARHLLACGPAYAFEFRPGVTRLAGVLPAGVPSGRYTVTLEARPEEYGSLEVDVAGPALPDAYRVAVILVPDATSRAAGAERMRRGLDLSSHRSVARIDAVAPGSYTVETTVDGPPGADALLLASATPTRVDIEAGEVAHVRLELGAGGGLEVRLEPGSGTPSLAIRAEGAAHWTRVPVGTRDARGGWSTSRHLTSDRTWLTSRPLAPGSYQVRLEDGSGVSEKTTVTVAVGAFTPVALGR